MSIQSRLCPSLVIALAIGCWAAPTISVAQGFDLRSLLPGNPRARADEARRKREDDQKRACESLQTWLGEAPIGIAPGRQTGADQQAAAMVLLEDGRFSRAFGKTYDQMPREELVAIHGQISRCLVPQGPLASYYEQRGVVYTALDPNRQPEHLRTINAARNASTTLKAMTQELPALQADEAGYARLGAIHQSGDAMLKTADKATAAAYTTALAAADARVGAPMQTAMAQQAVAGASGYEGLAQLANASAELHKRRPEPPGTRENDQLIKARMEQIGGELLAVERQRIDVLGTGLAGMERGVQWQAEFETRYRRYVGQVRAIGDMLAYFTSRRDDVMRSAAPDFQSTVRRTSDDSQLNQVQRRYLLASDSSTVPGTQMLSSIAQQRNELEKRAALGGANLDQERRETQANAGATGGGNRPSNDRPRPSGNGGNGGNGGGTVGTGSSGSTGNVEPTQEEMYDLVRSRYEGEAERVRALSARCGNSRTSDPSDAIVCLSVMMAGGMGADQPLKITRFEKLGCAVASGKPGWYCEFQHTVSGGPTKFMGPITQSLAGDGGVSNARFIKRSGSWVMITTTER